MANPHTTKCTELKRRPSRVGGRRTGETLLCSRCFRNEGLKLEAEKIGKKDGKPCKICKADEGAKLTAEELEELTRAFFVYGSASLTDGHGHIPIYQLGNKGTIGSSKVTFDKTLQKDYELISEHCPNILFLNSPSLGSQGRTSVYMGLTSALNRTVAPATLNDEARQVLDRVINYCKIVELEKGTRIYRIRRKPENPILFQEYDSPPAKAPKDRFDIDKAAVFYGSFDVESCIHECRATVYDEICLATFVTTKTMKIVDLENQVGSDPEIGQFIDNHLFGAEAYREGQALSKRIFERLYHGIRYPSYFSVVREGSYSNIALFGFPLKERRISLKSINRIRLSRVNYDYTFGPVFDVVKNNRFVDEVDQLFERWSVEPKGTNGKSADRYFGRLKRLLKKYS